MENARAFCIIYVAFSTRPQRIMLALYGALYGVSRGIGHYEH